MEDTTGIVIIIIGKISVKFIFGLRSKNFRKGIIRIKRLNVSDIRPEKGILNWIIVFWLNGAKFTFESYWTIDNFFYEKGFYLGVYLLVEHYFHTGLDYK